MRIVAANNAKPPVNKQPTPFRVIPNIVNHVALTLTITIDQTNNVYVTTPPACHQQRMRLAIIHLAANDGSSTNGVAGSDSNDVPMMINSRTT